MYVCTYVYVCIYIYILIVNILKACTSTTNQGGVTYKKTLMCTTKLITKLFDVARSNLGQVTRYGDQFVSLHCPKEQI